MSDDSDMVRSEIGERVVTGRSPALRRRRTKEYVPNCKTRQRSSPNQTPNEDDMLYSNEDENFAVQDNGFQARFFDENSNSLLRSTPTNTQLQDIFRSVPENSHLGERYQILRSENKILRERLQNALQREMKALKTFKRLAKENRQLKLNLRKYERTLLGLYDEESDSDHSEPPREASSRPRVTLSQTRGCVDDFHNNSKSEDDVFIERFHSSSPPTVRVSKSTNTTTQDISEPLKIDKSTSTADLSSFTDNDQENSSIANSSPESDAFKWTEQSPTERFQDSSNLTDSTKVQFLHSQLKSLERQSPQERRKFSHTNRYWTGPLVMQNYLDVSELQRASSSPSLLDGDAHENSQEVRDSERRVSEGSAPRQFAPPSRDFPAHPRLPSFYEDHMSGVPEVVLSRGEFDNSPRSSLSSTPSSKSQEDLASTSISPVLVLRNEDDTVPQPQPSPRASPLTIDVMIGPSPNSNLYVLDEVDSPQSSPQPSPGLARRTIGHTVSLPAASFGRYLSHMVQKENIEEEPVAKTLRKKSFDDDHIYVKKKTEPSVSLRFDGNIPKQNAENLAADIAEFLQMRERTRSHPEESSVEEAEPSEDATVSRAQSTRRRRGSAVVCLPGQTNYQMDLHVLGATHIESQLSTMADKKELSGSTTSLSSIDPEKRSRWSILRRNKKLLAQVKPREEKGPKNTEDFKECLARLRDTAPRYSRDHELAEYKDSHWTQLIMHTPEGSPRRPLSDGILGASTISDQETKRREALWELFHSEVVYATDHLLVLKEVFLDPLRKLQQEMGHLPSVDAKKIFCNLQDLCSVSTKFAKDLLLVFQSEQPTSQFGSTAAVVSAFTEFSSKVHPQYMRYCLNYSKALGYLDSMKKYEDFQYFIKWCESDPRCNRLQLTDLLVAPLQHLTKYPLLLKNIRKRTFEGDDQHNSLTLIIKSVELSIQQLEGKVKSLANYERLQELENSLVWPIITEIDPKTYVPEFLRPILAKQPRESLLASPKRQLLYEGPLTLIENTKLDVYAFLFDDMLLLSKSRKVPQKTGKKLSLAGMYTPPPMGVSLESPPSTPPTMKRTYSGMQFTVYKQPIPLDRFIVIDAESTTSTGSTLKNSFTVIHYNRFKQTVGLYTLQVSSQNLKETWTSKLKAAQGRWSETVAMEMAAESVRLQNSSTPTESPTSIPKSPEDHGDMNQNQILSYHKPIESHC